MGANAFGAESVDRSASRKRQVESTAQQLVLPDVPDGCHFAAHAIACCDITIRVWALNDGREM
jgi:hypothetical protein